MDKYKRYYGICIFIFAAFVLFYGSYILIRPKIEKLTSLNSEISKKQKELDSKLKEKRIVENKIKKIQDSITGAQKKIYSPIESDLGKDSLFFTLYNDVIEILHSNDIKIKSISYTYNPKDDEFVKFGKDVYFVCDVNINLVSNYISLGQLIQDIYQYPYYIKIKDVKISPYAKDKKILLTDLNLRLYAKTSPQEAY